MKFSDYQMLIDSVLENVPMGKLVDVSLELQRYVAMGVILGQHRVNEEGGARLTWRINKDVSDAARNVGRDTIDDALIEGATVTAGVDWAATETKAAWHLVDIDLNRHYPKKIFDIITLEVQKAKAALAVKMEENLLTLADPSDDYAPRSLPYYIVKNDTKGFTGGNPTGYSDVAGINADAPENTWWRNWSEKYEDATELDLFTKIQEALDKTQFVSPVEMIPAPGGNKDARSLITNYAVCSAAKKVAKDQNNQVGVDLDPYHDKVLVRRRPLLWAPKFDTDTSDPVYGVNWGWMDVATLRNWYMRESETIRTPLQHNVVRKWWDTKYNLRCYNRREHFVLHKGA